MAGTFVGSVGFGDTVLTGANGASAFVGKLDPSGTAQWARSFGPNVFGAGVAADASGNVIFTGSFETPVDFGCGTLAGMPDHFFQPFVVKLDAGGGCLWNRWFPDTEAGQAQNVATDASSNIVVTGSFNSSVDLGGGPIQATGDPEMFIVSLDADGGYRWGKGFGDVAASSLALNGAGDAFLYGLLLGPADFGGGTLQGNTVIFLASLDAMGGYRWARTFGQQPSSAVGPLAVDASHVFVAGGIGGTIDLGCGPSTSGADMDVFVAEFAQ